MPSRELVLAAVLVRTCVEHRGALAAGHVAAADQAQARADSLLSSLSPDALAGTAAALAGVAVAMDGIKAEAWCASVLDRASTAEAGG